jgi:hypothetical protein
MLVSSFAFAAELPSNYLVIGDKAIDLSYAMNNKEAFNTILGEYLAGGGTVEGLYVAIAGAVQDAYGNDLTQEQQETVVNQLMTLVNTENPDGTPLVTEVTLQTVTAANAENFVVTAALSGAPETTPVAEDFAVAITVDTVATALEGTFSYDTETNTATFTYPAIAKTDAEQTVNVEVTYKEGTAVAAEAITIPVNDDTTAPTITDAVVTNYQTLTVNFDEKVMGTATVTLNGTAVAAADVALAEDGMSLTLNKTAGYAAGAYTIVVNGLTDVAGNAMAENAQALATKAASYIADFNFTTTALQAAANNKVYFDSIDQYGETIANIASTDDNVVGTGFMGQLPLAIPAKGDGDKFVTLSDTLTEGAEVTVTLTNTVSTVEYTKSKTYTVGVADASVATSISSLTHATGNAITVADDNKALTVVVLDQYGNPVAGGAEGDLRWVTSDKNVIAFTSDNNILFETTNNVATTNVDAINPGTATISVFVGVQTTPAATLTITVGENALTALTLGGFDKTINKEAGVSLISPNAGAVIDAANFTATATSFPTGATAADIAFSFANGEGANAGKVAMTVTTQKAGAYNFTVASGEVTKTGTITTTVNQTVASIEVEAFATNELTAGTEVKKAVTFKNTHGEVISVNAQDLAVAKTANMSIAAYDKDDVSLTIGTTATPVAKLGFTATAAGDDTTTIVAGSVSKPVTTTAVAAATVSSMSLDSSSVSVIINNKLDAETPATDDAFVEDTDSDYIYTAIPVTFVDQYGNTLTGVKANDATFEIKDASGNNLITSKEVILLHQITSGAYNDLEATLTDTVSHIGVAALSAGNFTTTGVKNVTVTMKNGGGDVLATNNLAVNVQGVREAATFTNPTIATTVTNGIAQTIDVSAIVVKDQYGRAYTPSLVANDANTADNYRWVVEGQSSNDAIAETYSTNDIVLTAKAAGAGTETVTVKLINNGATTASTDDVVVGTATYNMTVDTLANSVDRIEIQPTVTVLEPDSGAPNGTYDASQYKVALDEDDANQTITFTVKAFDANNNEVSITQTSDVAYAVNGLTANALTTDDLSFTNNALTVDGSSHNVATGDQITVKATSLNGKVDTLVVTVDDIANAAATAGQYYLAATATGTEAITTADVNKQATVHVVGLNQFGKAVDVNESSAVVSAVAEDDNTVITHGVTADGIVMFGLKKDATTTLRVILNEGSQLTLAATVTAGDDAVVGVTSVDLTANGPGDITNEVITWTDSTDEEGASVVYYAFFGKDGATAAQVEALFTTKAQLDALVTAKQAMKLASTTGNDGGTGFTLGTALTKYAIAADGTANDDVLATGHDVETFVITIDLAGNIDVQTVGGKTLN